jgi:[ribosomal protein S18]-alanine N-acetyltransferase
MLEKLFSKKIEFEIVAMEDIHCRPASLLHGERFQRAWSDGEFQGLLGQDTVIGFVARQIGSASKEAIAGFVLVREAAGEAEILSIGVSSPYARQGLGWRLMRAALEALKARDAETVILEVDETNTAALALYRKLRFEKVAERPAYYTGPDGRKSKALVMRLDFAPGRGR